MMFGTALKPVLATGILAVAVASARDNALNNLVPLPGINYKFVKGRTPAVRDEVTQNYQIVHAYRESRTNSKSVAAILGAHQRKLGGEGYQNITSTTAYGTQYAIQLTFHEMPLMFVLDTGSSDTWAVQEGFQCVTYSGQEVDQDNCGFGPTYPAEFQYGYIPDEHLYIKYGDGETVFGRMGYSDITVGNITVTKQQVGLVNRTFWNGNNMTSGVIGLAFPTLTSAYRGNGSDHSLIERVYYSPLFTTMVSDGLVTPYFSVAINRNSSGGMLAWGGAPPVTGLSGPFAAMDLVITNLINNPFTTWDYSFYTIIPDGFQWGKTTDLRKFPFIVDTGTTLIYLPPPIAAAVNAAFQPAAVYLWMYGAYFTSCTAQAPPFAVILNGMSFYINPVDMIYRDMVDPVTGLCMTGIASGGSGPYILGDVFLQNVVAVFDVGNAQMRFTGRQFY